MRDVHKGLEQEEQVRVDTHAGADGHDVRLEVHQRLLEHCLRCGSVVGEAPRRLEAVVTQLRLDGGEGLLELLLRQPRPLGEVRGGTLQTDEEDALAHGGKLARVGGPYSGRRPP